MMFGVSAFSLFLLAAQGSSTSGGRITGRVTDLVSGAPISGARVTLTMVVDVPGGTFGRRPRQSITAANGAFPFDGLELAQYILNIEKTGFASYPDVLGDGPPERLTVDTKRTSASFMPMMAMADDDGTFTIGEVAPGTYHINATANAAGPAGGIGAASFGFVEAFDGGVDGTRTRFAVSGAPSGPGTITVSSADLTGLTVVANPR